MKLTTAFLALLLPLAITAWDLEYKGEKFEGRGDVSCGTFRRDRNRRDSGRVRWYPEGERRSERRDRDDCCLTLYETDNCRRRETPGDFKEREERLCVDTDRDYREDWDSYRIECRRR